MHSRLSRSVQPPIANFADNPVLLLRPWSLDSLDGGFVTRQFGPVGWSVKQKQKINKKIISIVIPPSKESTDHGLRSMEEVTMPGIIFFF